MAGELVPLVLLPRYSSYIGDGTFTTIGMEVTQYSKAILNVWRGALSSGTVAFTFQESTDQYTWTTCSGVSAGVDPGLNTEAQYSPELSKRWFRVSVVLNGVGTGVSCWAMGFLEQRES